MVLLRTTRKIMAQKGHHLDHSTPAPKQNLTAAQAHHKQARAFAVEGKWHEALTEYQQVLQLTPNWAEVYKELGNAYLHLQQWSDAVACYRQAYQRQHRTPQLYHNWADALSKLERWSAAVLVYKKAIELKPEFSWSHNNLGDALLKLGQWSEAVTAYRQAIELNPDFGLSYHNLGEAYTKLQQWENAIAAYHKSIELDPNFLWSYFQLGNVLTQQNRWSEALTAYEKAVEIEPNFHWSHYHLAITLAQQNRWSEALTAYEKAVEIEPNFAQGYSGLGDALMQQQKWEQAIDCYEKAIAIDPAFNVEIYRNLEEARARKIGLATVDATPMIDPKNQWPYITSQTDSFPKTLPDGCPWPKISIITPSYNQGEFIEETILSVIHQNYPNLEYILIDGGSTDDTVTVVERYREHLSYFISTPDHGQSDAINKGFRQASGEIVTWLNSDDRFAPGALYAAALAFYTSGADVVAGLCQLFQTKEEVLHHMTSCAPGQMPLEDILDVENCWLAGKFFHQPEVMFTRAIWEKVGGAVDESLYYSMDYELWARFAAAGAKICPISHPIAQFRMHEAQKTSATEKYKPELLATRDQLRSRFQAKITPTDSSFVKSEPVAKRHQLRVVLFSDLGFSGGAGIAHEQIGQAIAAAGHQVIPIKGASQWQPQPIEFLAEDAIELIACLEPDLVVVGNLHNLEESVEFLEQICKKYPTIFVMHDQWLLTGRCAYTGQCDQYTTSCTASCPTHEQYPALTPEKISPTFERKRKLLVKSDNLLVVGNSQWTTNWARQAFKSSLPPEQKFLLEKRIQKITLSLDLETFKPRDQQDCRQRLGLPDNKFIILTGCTSIEDERKGGKYLIQALKFANLDNVLLVGFGYGSPLEDELNFEINHTGFIQNRTLLAYYYSAADLFVGASLEETLGLTFLEAAACGTPAVGYASGGVQEAIRDQVTGRLVREKTPSALAKVISELYQDSDQLERLSRSAPLYIASHFSIRSTYQSLVVALERVKWLEKLQIAPISKFRVTPPEIPPALCVKYLLDINPEDDIIEGKEIKGCVFGGFGALEPPYPDLNLASQSRWALWPESQFLIETNHHKKGHLILSYRSVCSGQVLEVWCEDKLLVSTLVEASEITQENILTFPVNLQKGLNFFTIKTDRYSPDLSQRKLAVLVEKVTFTEELNWQNLGNAEKQGVTEKLIRMDGTLQGTGWFPWESLNGIPIRWMERVGSVIVDRMNVTQPLQVKVGVIAAVDSRFAENLTLKVNGNQILAEVKPLKNQSWELEAKIPARMLTPDAPFVLSLHAPDVKQLSPQDSRHASVLVQDILLKTIELEPSFQETVILMDENLQGTGWFAAEQHNNTPVRWMQKVGSIVVEEVDTTKPFQVKVQGVAATEQQFIDHLKLRVNGTQVQGKVQHQLDGQWQFEGQVADGILPDNAPFLLTLEAPKVKQLSSEDQRCCSLLVQEIRFVGLN